MRNRTWILAIVVVTVAWAAAARRSESRQVPAEQILTKDGLTLDQFQQRNAQLEQQRRASVRNECSGSLLGTGFLPPGTGQKTAEELAALFRRQSPVPADRVTHFQWLGPARQVVSFIGWNAGLTAADRRGDELWIELSVTPSLESEAGAIGALSNDRYIETYVVRDGHFHYQGGRPAPIVRREVWPNPESGDFFVFD